MTNKEISVQQGHKWETCFECPLSHGCPKIKGCTNEQAIEYASQIPNNCPLSAQPEIIRCKDCKHFHFDMPYVIQGIPVLGHEVCDAWGDGCKTAQDGYCFMAERRTDD